MQEQKTLALPARISGVGLHTGQEVEVELLPADVGTGVVFVRTDLPNEPAVEAHIKNLVPRRRRTVLAKGKAEIQTVEHLLAALVGAGIDNIEVRLNGPELPGLDGSALPYYEAIKEAGHQHQGRRSREIYLRQPLAVTDGGSSIVALAKKEGLTVGFTLDLGSSAASKGDALLQYGTQYLELEINEETFAKEIAPARTFVLEEEVRQLQAEGFGKGANTDNTLVLGKDGIIDNELRFRDEFVRHKILDLIGDLRLTGCRLHGKVIATKSGHDLNVQLARLILENSARELEMNDIVAGADNGLDIRQLEKLLPHRYPFLLVDKILEFEAGRRAVGLKNVTYNEQFFQGHFPGHPVMPGVLQVEAMAQVAGALLITNYEEARRLAFLLSLDQVKFRKTVVPGDQLLLEAELQKVRSRTAMVKTTATVAGTVVAEAQICFMIVDAY